MKTLTFIPFLFLVGCGWFNSKPDVVINTDHINVCVNPPKADPVIMREVSPLIIKDSSSDLIFVGILPKEYENLASNIQEMLKHIRQQNAIIEYYKGCYSEKKKEEKK